MLAVVRDEDVVADEGAELGPHLGKRSRIPHIRIGVAVHLGRPRRDPPVEVHHRIPPHHPPPAPPPLPPPAPTPPPPPPPPPPPHAPPPSPPPLPYLPLYTSL